VSKLVLILFVAAAVVLASLLILLYSAQIKNLGSTPILDNASQLVTDCKDIGGTDSNEYAKQLISKVNSKIDLSKNGKGRDIYFINIKGNCWGFWISDTAALKNGKLYWEDSKGILQNKAFLYK
jgi:hypothetical protein